jgi:hypothetical protein
MLRQVVDGPVDGPGEGRYEAGALGVGSPLLRDRWKPAIGQSNVPKANSLLSIQPRMVESLRMKPCAWIVLALLVGFLTGCGTAKPNASAARRTPAAPQCPEQPAAEAGPAVGYELHGVVTSSALPDSLVFSVFARGDAWLIRTARLDGGTTNGLWETASVNGQEIYKTSLFPPAKIALVVLESNSAPVECVDQVTPCLWLAFASAPFLARTT